MFEAPAYSSLQESGSARVGAVPAHWTLTRLKVIGRLLAGSAFPPELQGTQGDELPFYKVGSLVASSDGKRIVGASDSISVSAARILRARIVPPGSVVYAKIGAALFLNRRRLTSVPCCIDNNMTAFVPDPRQVHPDWAFYYLSNLDLRELANPGAVPSVSEGYQSTALVALPPLVEQAAIAAFLDRETVKIDALVAKKRRQVELLQEKRTAVVSRAVTKGTDPSVAMRPSGVEWLGSIPIHWKTKRLKLLSSLQTGLTLGKKYEGRPTESRPYLRVANVQDGYFDLEDVAEIEAPSEIARGCELRAGDVLMTEGGDFDKLGRGFVWEGQISDCLHQNHIFAVRTRQDELNPHFISAVTGSAYGRAYFTATSNQSTNLASTNSAKIKNFPVPLPAASEQQAIIEFINRECLALDTLRSRIRDGIQRLIELRNSLISAAVTGKIDVRREVA